MIKSIKECKNCHEEKDSINFSYHPTTADKLYPNCKKCVREYNQKHYEKNREKRKKQIKNWNCANIDKMKKYKQEWEDRQKTARSSE